jgi:hypothetical protein
MTTTKTLTDSQIRSLRTEALEHNDDEQLVICDIALDSCHEDCCGGGATGADGCAASLSDVYAAVRLDRRTWDRLEAMTQDEAIAEIASVIRDAEAQA